MMTFDTLDNRIKNILEKADIKSAPVNVRIVAKSLGITVRMEPRLELENIIGRIFFEEQTPVIEINPFQNNREVRERFTLAHEIGHYVLHSSQTKHAFKDSRESMNRESSYWSVEETEANDFAANLLMPSDLIFSTIKDILRELTGADQGSELNQDIFLDRMASLFNVSGQAMRYRLKNLRIIG